jgi:16S rRNA (cytosine1402-N4)-methyltransferase
LSTENPFPCASMDRGSAKASSPQTRLSRHDKPNKNQTGNPMNAPDATQSDPEDGSRSGAEAPKPHLPVMLAEVLAALQPIENGIFVDGTFGAGGYTTALLEAGAAHVYALDRDPTAIEAGQAICKRFPGRLTLIEGRFSDMAQHLEAQDAPAPDGVVLDIGVSSMQIDRPERGFSFQKDGPLDMRMSNSGPTAADVVNQMSHGELAHILKFLGEERQAGRIASAILKRRLKQPLETTNDLAETVSTVIPRKAKDRIHPATRTFQALRIFVNRELEELAMGLSAAEHKLKTGGRLVIVTFHSLEDRIAKTFFNTRSETRLGGSRHAPELAAIALPSFQMKTRKALAAGEPECRENPRARSAKLRVGERTEHAAFALDMAALGVPRLPGFHGLEP